MPATTAELAVRLPWLAPGVPALAAVARGANGNDPAILSDPAAICLILRFSNSLNLSRPQRAKLLRFVRKQLARRPAGLVRLDARPIARAARINAPRLSRKRAYVVGAISQIGRLAIAAIDPNAICDDSAREVARSLARRWGIAHWCMAALDVLDHPLEVVEKLGGDTAVIKAVRAADASLAQLPPSQISDPYGESLLPQLLELAERNCRRKAVVAHRLEVEVEQKNKALCDYVAHETARLQERKLVALAEFAAGAGHEINTPLAIISGQSQFLLNTEVSPDRRKALQTVVQQAHRVHDLLTDLMQFARPGVTQWQLIDLGMLAREVVASFLGQAQAKDVHIESAVADGVIACADPRQFRIALSCLVRNAIEAVPSAGQVWVRSASTVAQNSIIVEDSGPGVDPAIVEYIFDPFFSGRSAGRGRGLGLPTAWRLARQQGGDVRYVQPGLGLTQFVLTLPAVDADQSSSRRSA